MCVWVIEFYAYPDGHSSQQWFAWRLTVNQRDEHTGHGDHEHLMAVEHGDSGDVGAFGTGLL